MPPVDPAHLQPTPPSDQAASGLPEDMLTYVLHVDGERRNVDAAWLGESLQFVLQNRLGVRGAKAGCNDGRCGVCTVLVDGRLGYACLTLAGAAIGSTIVTVRGLGEDAAPIARALVEHGAVQCGVCAPGLVTAIHDLLARNTYPDEQDIADTLSGTPCSCNSGGRILDAVRALVTDR